MNLSRNLNLNSTTQNEEIVPVQIRRGRVQSDLFNRDDYFIDGQINFRSGSQNRSGINLALWSWMSAFIDTLVLTSISCFGLILVSFLMKTPARELLKVISIEPVPQTYKILEKNISINKIQTKVKGLNIGIGNKKDTLFFTKNLDTVNHVVLSKLADKSNLIEVPIENLDTILLNSKTPSLLKIDVEGFEQEVINGATAVLANEGLKAIIIELNGSGERYGYKEEKIHQQLLANGFSPYLYKPFEREILSVNTFGNQNTIYLKDIEFVKARLKSAKNINIFSESF